MREWAGDLGFVLGLIESLAELVELLDVLGLVGGVCHWGSSGSEAERNLEQKIELLLYKGIRKYFIVIIFGN